MKLILTLTPFTEAFSEEISKIERIAEEIGLELSDIGLDGSTAQPDVEEYDILDACDLVIAPIVGRVARRERAKPLAERLVLTEAGIGPDSSDFGGWERWDLMANRDYVVNPPRTIEDEIDWLKTTRVDEQTW